MASRKISKLDGVPLLGDKGLVIRVEFVLFLSPHSQEMFEGHYQKSKPSIQKTGVK